MLQIGEDVFVVKEQTLIGFGKITNIVTSIEELKNYFHISHPSYSFYVLQIYNQQPIFIVSFEDDMGQGGYIQKEIKKNCKKALA